MIVVTYRRSVESDKVEIDSAYQRTIFSFFQAFDHVLYLHVLDYDKLP